MNRVPLTVQGADRLREELKRLKMIERPKVTNAIAEARAHGDLKENAEYHAAREQQSFMEGRITDLESQLSRAQLIDPSKLNAGDKIVFGAHVTIFNESTEAEVVYQIVGDLEADIDQGLISVHSPIARALIGKEVGDIVNVKAPAGDIEYEIVEVEYK